MKRHYEETGSVEFDKVYIKEHGKSLHNWVQYYRRRYRESGHGRLNKGQVALLEEIGIV